MWLLRKQQPIGERNSYPRDACSRFLFATNRRSWQLRQQFSPARPATALENPNP
jgi:hypothetical protein